MAALTSAVRSGIPVTMGTGPQPPPHDPWLVHLDRWTLRILKLGCFACVLIFLG